MHIAKFVHYIFYVFFLLEFNLPTYSITPSAHPFRCPPQCPSPSHPIPSPTHLPFHYNSSAIRNDKYPPFASTWMELEGFMLSEISQSEKDKHYMVSFIWGI